MNKFFCVIAIALVSLAAPTARAVVGYVNLPFQPNGYTPFVNPLEAPDNHISQLLPAVPDGSEVLLWNASSQVYYTPSVFSSGSGWTLDYVLAPGTGAFFYSPSATPFTNTFVGTVLNHDGSFLPAGGYPATFSGPAGLYLLGDKTPVLSTGTNIFLNVLGRLPNLGEQVIRFDPNTQSYFSSTYQGAGAWDLLPSLNVGEAAFFNVGPVPEPSVAAIGLFGLAVLRTYFRRRS